MIEKIKIFLNNCRVNLSVGIYEQEKLRSQPVIINVILDAELTDRFADPKSDAIAQTVSYETIRNFICHDLKTYGHIPLLESVATLILDFCMRDKRVTAAQVSVAKPEIFPETEAVGITLSRQR